MSRWQPFAFVVVKRFNCVIHRMDDPASMLQQTFHEISVLQHGYNIEVTEFRVTAYFSQENLLFNQPWVLRCNTRLNIPRLADCVQHNSPYGPDYFDNVLHLHGAVYHSGSFSKLQFRLHILRTWSNSTHMAENTLSLRSLRRVKTLRENQKGNVLMVTDHCASSGSRGLWDVCVLETGCRRIPRGQLDDELDNIVAGTVLPLQSTIYLF
jgi:hypothetical protein